jgi:plasmid stability protein
MAAITIRQLEEKIKSRLRVRAAHHGRSMEEEAREILRAALTGSLPPEGDLTDAIRRRFAAFGGFELEPPRRDALRSAPEFGDNRSRDNRSRDNRSQENRPRYDRSRHR